MASGLSKRVLILENLIRLYRFLHDRLKYLQPSVSSLISQAAANGEFAQLAFLGVCRDEMQAGNTFPESWRIAVEKEKNNLGANAAAIVATLAEVLGAADLESQLAALQYGVSLLESRLEEARSYAAKHKKLYQTLGILAGLGLAVIIA